jgi:hypothetical protein
MTFDNYLKKLKDEEIYLSTRPIRRFIRYSLIPFLYNLPDVPRDIYRKIKRGYQRAYRGWADEDTWSFDSYLSKITSEGIIHLSKTTYGYPCDLNSLEEWKVILDKIAWSFKIHENGINNNLPLDEVNIDKYNEGWRLFQKYFQLLWG